MKLKNNYKVNLCVKSNKDKKFFSGFRKLYIRADSNTTTGND